MEEKSEIKNNCFIKKQEHDEPLSLAQLQTLPPPLNSKFNQNFIVPSPEIDKISSKIPTKTIIPIKAEENLSFWNTFKEQKVRGWHFVPSFFCGFTINFIIALFLIICGSIHLAMTADLIEVERNFLFLNKLNLKFKVPYGDLCINDTLCLLSIKIAEDIEGPVYLYYGIKHFYQNHRK